MLILVSCYQKKKVFVSTRQVHLQEIKYLAGHEILRAEITDGEFIQCNQSLNSKDFTEKFSEWIAAEHPKIISLKKIRILIFINIMHLAANNV